MSLRRVAVLWCLSGLLLFAAAWSSFPAHGNEVAHNDAVLPEVFNDVPAASEAVSAGSAQMGRVLGADVATVIGASVVGAAGSPIGKVWDVISAPNGPVSLIVETPGYIGIAEHVVAIPIDRASYDQSSGVVVLSGLEMADILGLLLRSRPNDAPELLDGLNGMLRTPSDIIEPGQPGVL